MDDVRAVERALVAARLWQARDARVGIRDMSVLDLEATLTRAVYIRYLLPIWFDMQHIAAKAGHEPTNEWRFAPARS